jgi:C1A family cysteine protease
MSEPTGTFGMGWLPDYPDCNDLTIHSDKVSAKQTRLGQKESVKSMIDKIGVGDLKKSKLPPKADLRQWCSPIEHQGTIGACTAHAGVGLLEYFERKAFGKHIDASRLFLYKTTRNLLKQKGDTGAYLRTTMQAMVLFGVPPEEYWKYDADDFDKEPTAFCYSFAQNFQTINYYRLDYNGIDPEALLLRIKTNLNAGLPSMF